MKYVSTPISGLIAALFFIVGPGLAVAGPLHDPWLEQFQVGTWSRAAEVQVDQGYPAGLLEPAVLDTVWTAAAGRLLNTATSESGRSSLTTALLAGLSPEVAPDAWLATARQALDDLVARREGSAAVTFLRPERLTLAFGRAVDEMDLPRAAEIATRLENDGDQLGLPVRERLVWHLRAQLCRHLSGAPAISEDRFWPGMTELGPFDMVNAWALWQACRAAQGRALLPREEDSRDLVTVLRQLPAGSVPATELYGADLKRDIIAGLGGIVLSNKELSAHFARFAEPPSGFAEQGQWVRGQRRLRKGVAASYENLARMPGLQPAWRLDVWRRASERRLLKGAWVEGLADLGAAADLARAGHGTLSLRKRLRQWLEQAVVLALAEDDPRTARQVLSLGDTTFVDDEKLAFGVETDHWRELLGTARVPLGYDPADRVDSARVVVAAGKAPDLLGESTLQRQEFMASEAATLWPLWVRWGVALADPEPVSGARRERAIRYRDLLQALPAGDSGPDFRAAALMIVGQRLGDRPWREVLLRSAVAVDVSRLSEGRTPPRSSPVPELLPAVRGSELDRHALLGFCLASGDMRGTLGLAYELPARGLTRAEKRLFLYPLPMRGAIRDAIGAAKSEPALLLAIARNESLFEPAVRSRAGALGWMQIMPFHYPEKGALSGAKNWRTPAVSIRQGDQLLVENAARYKRDPYRAVAAYNAGPAAAGRWDDQLGGAAPRDVYLAWIGYTETRAYVEKVLIDREIYTQIIGAKTGAGSTPGPTAGPNNE